MKKLKILWLHPQLTNWFGGNRFVYNVIKELSDNHDVELYVQKSTEEMKNKFIDSNISVNCLSNKSTGDFTFWLNFEREIKKQIKTLEKISSNYDIVISSVFPMNIIADSIEIPHIQYVFEPFAFFWDPKMINNLSFAKKVFLKILRKKIGNKDITSTQRSNKILTINSGTKKEILKIYGKESVPTLLGVDTDFFKNIKDKKLLNDYRNKKILIHSTDWTPLKKTDWLIDQFISISSRRDDLVLLVTEVIEKGHERNKVIKKIKDKNIKNIKLCGQVPFKILPKYYATADIGIYTGVGEGASAASLFVLECMASETPVIRTNGTNDEVQHNENGFLFEANNSNEFQNMLIKLLDNESIRKQFGENARKYIIKNYSWKKVSDIFERECRDLIK